MTELAPGAIAPQFSGTDQNGENISLNDFLGKKVVLYFYPKDNTPGCTTEACNLRDNYEDLAGAGFEVIGVSADSVASHKKFETKYKLPFHLIADTEKKIINLYGVWGEKNLYGIKMMGLKRTTFLIDEKGIIFKIFRRPNTKAHSEEILASLQ